MVFFWKKVQIVFSILVQVSPFLLIYGCGENQNEQNSNQFSISYPSQTELNYKKEYYEGSCTNSFVSEDGREWFFYFFYTQEGKIYHRLNFVFDENSKPLYDKINKDLSSSEKYSDENLAKYLKVNFDSVSVPVSFINFLNINENNEGESWYLDIFIEKNNINTLMVSKAKKVSILYGGTEVYNFPINMNGEGRSDMASCMSESLSQVETYKSKLQNNTKDGVPFVIRPFEMGDENVSSGREVIEEEIENSKSQATGLMLSCKARFPNGDPIYVSIDSKPWGKKKLSCIRTMAAEGETCALNGGASKLYQTGTARIQSVFERIMDSGGEPGTYIEFGMDKRQISFNGGYLGNGGWSRNWSFDVDRTSGAALLKADQDVGVQGGAYACVRDNQVF